MNGITADNCAKNNHNNSTQHTTGMKQYMCLAHAFIKVQLGATSNIAIWTPIWAKQAAAATGTVEAFLIFLLRLPIQLLDRHLM